MKSIIYNNLVSLEMVYVFLFKLLDNKFSFYKQKVEIC